MQPTLDNIFQMIDRHAGLSIPLQKNLIATLLVMLTLIMIRRVAISMYYRTTAELSNRYRFRKISAYITSFLALILVGRIWFAGMGVVITILGFLSAGLAIALQELVKGMAGWIYVLWRHPFRVGDRIEIGQFRGDVVDIRMFKFSLLEIGNWVDADQSTGRVIHLSNSMILDAPIANYTEGFDFIWNELGVVVTFESDWRKAKTLLIRLANEFSSDITGRGQKQLENVSHNFMIFYRTLTPIVYTSVIDIGVRLTIRYIVEPRNRRGSSERFWEAILDQFAAQPDIDFAYPTIRYYDNRTEGKSGTPIQPGENQKHR